MLAQLLGIGASFWLSRHIKKSRDLDIQVLHASPGRLRLKCAQWKNEMFSAYLPEKLQEHPLVTRAESSPITGSLLLEFKEPKLTPEQLDEIMKLTVQSTLYTYRKTPSKLMETIKGTVSTINQEMKVQTKGYLDLKALLILSLVGKVVWDSSKNRPITATLLLWAYSLTIRKDGEDEK